MAKKTSPTTMLAVRPENGTDAAAFADIHWFALSIERSAMEIYVTNAGSLKSIVAILKTALTELNKTQVAAVKDKRGDEECPSPWVWCPDRNRCCGDSNEAKRASRRRRGSR